jgi:hypothetical protein
MKVNLKEKIYIRTLLIFKEMQANNNNNNSNNNGIHSDVISKRQNKK